MESRPTSGTRWHPDPRRFLDRRLEERGVSTREFLAARPCRWWSQLVREFDEPLAPVQLMAYVQDAAASGHWLDWYARDALVRVLHRHLPAGGGAAARRTRRRPMPSPTGSPPWVRAVRAAATGLARWPTT